jgi:hypothetical protein
MLNYLLTFCIRYVRQAVSDLRDSILDGGLHTEIYAWMIQEIRKTFIIYYRLHYELSQEDRSKQEIEDKQ